MSKLCKILTYIIEGIFLCVTLFLFRLSISKTVLIKNGDRIFFENSAILYFLILLTLVAVLFLVYHFGKNVIDGLINKRWFMVVIVISYALMLLAFVLLTQLKPISDEGHVLRVAGNLINGIGNDWLPDNYMFVYPFQNGIVLYEYMMLKLLGINNYVALECLNVLFVFGAFVCMIKILEAVDVDKSMRRMAFIALLMWFPISMYVTYVYGNIIGFFFTLLAVALEMQYFRDERWYKLILSAICIGMATTVKSNYKIALVAMIIMYLFYALDKKKIKALAGIVLSLIMCFGIQALTDKYIEFKTGVDTPQGTPMICWVAMGITNYDDYGWFNNYHTYSYKKNNYDYELTKKEAKQLIFNKLKEYVNSPQNGKTFIKKKIESIWCQPTFQAFFVQDFRETDIEMPPLVQKFLNLENEENFLLVVILDFAQSLVYLGAALYMIFRWNKNSIYQLVFAIIFIGGFLFHLAWEAASQYTIIYFVLIIPYAIYGFKELFNSFDCSYEKWRLSCQRKK